MFPKRVRGEMLAKRVERNVLVRKVGDGLKPYNEPLGQDDANAALKAARKHRNSNGS
jgi:hypothetical protein